MNNIDEQLRDILKTKKQEVIDSLKKSLNDKKLLTSSLYSKLKKIVLKGKLSVNDKEELKNELKELLISLGYATVFVLPAGTILIMLLNLIKKKMKKNNINESNKIKGGKADNKTPKDIANKFSISVNKVEKQIEKGKQVESEHTDDEEKIKEISMDHLYEFPDYYDRLEKMEKQAKKYWDKKEKTNESKSFIKKILKENL